MCQEMKYGVSRKLRHQVGDRRVDPYYWTSSGAIDRQTSLSDNRYRASCQLALLMLSAARGLGQLLLVQSPQQTMVEVSKSELVLSELTITFVTPVCWLRFCMYISRYISRYIQNRDHVVFYSDLQYKLNEGNRDRQWYHGIYVYLVISQPVKQFAAYLNVSKFACGKMGI